MFWIPLSVSISCLLLKSQNKSSCVQRSLDFDGWHLNGVQDHDSEMQSRQSLPVFNELLC